MNAEALANALEGHRAGATWMARCPAHDDRRPSLSISTGKDGKVLVRCHTGCEQRHVIAALVDRGLWSAMVKTSGHFSPAFGNRIVTKRDPKEMSRTEAALAIWQASQPADGSLVELYLRSRGLDVPIPPSLRFHPGLKHASGGVWRAMVALVVNSATGNPVGIHRTYLGGDGQGKAPVVPAKMMLGPCRGGVVRLAEPGTLLMVGEGIETCLAAMQATGNPAWAALSTSGLYTLDLPPSARDVIVLADGDPPGEAAAQSCGQRLKRQGRKVRIARPPQGLDFNDMLVNSSTITVENENE